MVPVAAVMVACTVCANPGPTDALRADGARIEMEAGAEARIGGIAVGGGADAVDLVERRLEARFAIRPVSSVEVAVAMPTLFRSFNRAGARWSTVEPGDLDLQLNATLYQDRSPLSHAVFMTSLLKFPTAPVALDPDGAMLESILQPGCSSVVPSLGGGYELGWSVVSFQFNAALLVPIVVREAPHRGTSFRQTSTVRARPATGLAFTAGWTWLLEAVGQDQFDAIEENSGGTTGYVSAGVEAGRPGVLVAAVGLDLPAVTFLRGEQQPTPIGFARLTFGWDAPDP